MSDFTEAALAEIMEMAKDIISEEEGKQILQDIAQAEGAIAMGGLNAEEVDAHRQVVKNNVAALKRKVLAAATEKHNAVTGLSIEAIIGYVVKAIEIVAPLIKQA